MRTKTIQAQVEAPTTYPTEFVIRDLVVQIFSQVEPYIFYEEADRPNGIDKVYRATLKLVLNDKGVS